MKLAVSRTGDQRRTAGGIELSERVGLDDSWSLAVETEGTRIELRESVGRSIAWCCFRMRGGGSTLVRVDCHKERAHWEEDKHSRDDDQLCKRKFGVWESLKDEKSD